MERTDNAVELWAEEFSKKPIRLLTEKEMGGFICWRIVDSNKSFDDNELKKILEDKKGGLGSVFYLRVKYRHTYEVSPVLAAYLGDNILKNFGMSTMMANYLQWFCFKNKIKKLTLEDFAKKVFPVGVPKDEVWEEMWSLQKVKTENCMIDSDNGLDHQELMKSIINIRPNDGNKGT